jgi:hypothetical protein
MDIKILMGVLGMMAKLNMTSLKFDGSRSFEATGGEGVTGGVTLQGVKMINKKNDETQWFEFIGGGIGVGIGLPAGGSFSDESFPSSGTHLMKNPFRVIFTLDFDDLPGVSHIITFSANLVGGEGFSLILFNEFLDAIAFKAALFCRGIVVGTPGVGIMCYKGIWRKA